MKVPIPTISPIWYRLLALVLVVGLAWVSSSWWMPRLQEGIATVEETDETGADHEDSTGHAHEHEGHEHGGQGDPNLLELSEQARKSIGLKTGKVELTTYSKTISIPAMVVRRPGRTLIQSVAPMTALVEEVFAVEGESVHPGQPLFTIRLTHEDLVETQTKFLQALEELDVENREIDRIKEISEEGIIAGKRLLERQYEKDKLQALLRAQRQALLLHGLSEKQIAEIEQTRTLVRKLTVKAPALPRAQTRSERASAGLTSVDSQANQSPGGNNSPRVLSVHDLKVHEGELVEAGKPLASLADFTQLYIEGRAFEQDAQALINAANQGWTVTAVIEDRSGELKKIPRLEIVYVSNEVNPETRAFYFYVELPNSPVRDITRKGHRYISWNYKPGQRLEVQVPIEKWTEQIVLPVDAVAYEGAENYVFRQDGDHFHRLPVNVAYRGQNEVVIANDGSLFPGNVVALNGAHQLQMALKKKAGGGGGGHHGHMH